MNRQENTVLGSTLPQRVAGGGTYRNSDTHAIANAIIFTHSIRKSIGDRFAMAVNDCQISLDFPRGQITERSLRSGDSILTRIRGGLINQPFALNACVKTAYAGFIDQMAASQPGRALTLRLYSGAHHRVTSR
jgi:hypothetical protein